MTVKVKTLTGREIEIDIEPTDTVERIKERVEEKEGIPPIQQRLIFAGETVFTSFPFYISDMQVGLLAPCACFRLALPLLCGSTISSSALSFQPCPYISMGRIAIND